MYQSMIENKRLQYAMMLQGLDKILETVDPEQIAKRRMAIMQADYESQYGFPEKAVQAQAMLLWHQRHPGQPWLSPTQQLAYNKLGQQQADIDSYNNAFSPEGGGGQGGGNEGKYGMGALPSTGSQQSTGDRWERYKQLEQSWLNRVPGSEDLWSYPVTAPAMAPPAVAPATPTQQVTPTSGIRVSGPDITQPVGEEEEEVPS